ncbi:CYTH domain-containing protein [Alistipes sp. Z76]|nr:CYTH domain-containing protein [Alistipes sp. Z76]NCE68503.1 CYTH domain-containing protein [Muribaculaceae bacterium M3]
MAKEIERKFLVAGDYKRDAASSSHIVQGYIGRTPSLTFRVRIRDERGYLTVKGRTDAAGVSRDEWEYEIPLADACELLSHGDGTIEKRRYLVPAGRHTFEVDEFFGANEGLAMAEVELSSPDEEFARPEWLGEEVTGDKRYYNSQLLEHPYSTWKK